jgi:CHAD domain-containing protein
LILREYVRSHTAALFERMTTEVGKAAARDDEESVHDLRVSIRRLRECLRTFKDLYPPAPRKTISQELQKLMKCAELVRSADIALDLLKKAALDETVPLVREIREKRAQHREALSEALKSFANRPEPRAWPEALGL